MYISQLSGSLNEQAKQLLDILKTQQLSVEELDKLVPMGTDFVKEFCSVLREQVLSEKESHKISVGVFETVMSKLADSLGNKDLDKDERKQILETISDLGNKLRDLQINKQNNDTYFKGFIATCATLVVLVICILAGKEPPKNLHI